MYQAISAGIQKRRGARRRAKRFQLRYYMRERSALLAERCAEICLFFFLCLSECFELPSPFAICALAAYLLCRKKLLFPLAGILLSLGLRLIWGTDPDIWQYIGLALLFAARLKPPTAIWTASAYAACALSLRLFSQILRPTTQQEMILCTVSLMVGTLCTPAICHAVQIAEERRSRMHIDDLLCAVVLGAVMLSGAGRVAVGGVNVGFVLSGLAILLSASIGGCMAAVCAGLISGISLSLCGHSDGYVVCFAFSGIVCGLFYGRKRAVLGFVYLLCCLFTSYAIRFRLDLPFLMAGGFAVLVYWLLPEKRITWAFVTVRTLLPDAGASEAAYARQTRAQWVDSLSRLARQLPEIRLPEPNGAERLEDIMLRLCQGCESLPQCWQARASETRAALKAYFIDGNRSSILADCLRREAWPSLVLEEESSEQQRMQRYAYAQREREATRTHLTAIAQAMTRISREERPIPSDDERLRGEAEYVMRRLRITGRVLYALRVSRHIRVALRFEPMLTQYKQLTRCCEELSRSLEVPLHIAQRGKDHVVFEETPPMATECFHLTASAGDGEGANGDSVLMRSAGGGMEICMLSDGMGHGDQAHIESKETLELLSLCLDAGYTVSAALDAINCIMLNCTDGEQYATVDLCVADLWRSSATLDKLGACPSLLISGGTLRTLESSALPLGILPQVQPSSHTFAFGDGDMLIQFTDGLSDACGGMQALERQVELLMHDQLHRSPEAVCTALISAAMRRSGGAPQDDLTVLCTLFKKRQSKRREKRLPPEEKPYDNAL